MAAELSTNNPFSERPAEKYFVGRDDQVSVFESALNDLVAGTAGHILVGGLDGSGKTSFLSHLRSLADAAGFAGCKIKLDKPEGDPGTRGLNNIRGILRTTAERLDASSDGALASLAAEWDRGNDSPMFQQCRVDTLRTDLVEHDFAELSSQATSRSIPGIVLCIDEGQWLAPNALSTLKNALQDSNGYLVVISLRVPALQGDAVTAARSLLDQTALDAAGDIGASRFFMTPLEMGPFASLAEGERCITRRLEGNKLRFAPSTVHDIVQLADRAPGKIVSYARALYLTAQQNGSPVADDTHLADVVRSVNRIHIEHAAGLVADLSPIVRKAVKHLADRENAVSPASIARHIYPELDSGAAEGVSEMLDQALRSFSSNSRSCEHDGEGRFRITDPLERYCLRTAFDDE